MSIRGRAHIAAVEIFSQNNRKVNACNRFVHTVAPDFLFLNIRAADKIADHFRDFPVADMIDDHRLFVIVSVGILRTQNIVARVLKQNRRTTKADKPQSTVCAVTV